MISGSHDFTPMRPQKCSKAGHTDESSRRCQNAEGGGNSREYEGSPCLCRYIALWVQTLQVFLWKLIHKLETTSNLALLSCYRLNLYSNKRHVNCAQDLSSGFSRHLAGCRSKDCDKLLWSLGSSLWVDSSYFLLSTPWYLDPFLSCAWELLCIVQLYTGLERRRDTQSSESRNTTKTQGQRQLLLTKARETP